MSVRDALELDRRARQEALDVHRSVLLQAPAGSGKTTVLTARYLALLAVVDEPEQILAITFTRKAAAEMRHRILLALQAAESGESIAGIEPTLLQAVARRDRECDWQLLRNAARLRVETIDALCLRLASALPIAARSGTRLKIAPNPQLLYARAARQALRAALPEAATAGAARLWFARLDNSWRRLELLLAGMLARRSHWLPQVLERGADQLVQRVSTGLDAVLRAELAGMAARLPAPLLREAERLLAAFEPGAPAPTLSAEPSSLPQWRALCALTLTREDAWRRRLSAREGYEPHEQALKQRVLDFIGTASAHPDALQLLCQVRALPEPRLTESDRLAIAGLAQLLLRAAAELQLLFAEQGRVDFGYVAAAARQGLIEQGEPSDFALRASGALRHLLVDEFQDTSLEQFELLRALTAGWERGDGRTLFLVGDPMQSIYQFRDAEVGLFLRARDHGLGDIALEMLQLRRNFRSRAALIEWINAHFAQLFPPQDDARLAAVRYLPSVPAELAAGAADGTVRLHRMQPGDRVGEAERVLQIVRLERARAPQASIAVLVAAREHVAAIAARLRAAGIALRGVELEPLRERPVIRDLASIARALLHAGDRAAWLALLRAPWCGLTLVQLETLLAASDGDLFAALRAYSPADDEQRDRIARLCRALEPALLGEERGWPLWQRVQRAWLRLAGPAIYREEADRLDAQRFIDALFVHEAPETLVGEGMSAVTERLYSAAPAKAGAIEVMTMHAAKGLEWDVVILPGLGRRGATDEDPLLHWIDLPRAGAATDLLLAPIRASGEEAENTLAGYIKMLKRERKRLERVRQLYVAATRARTSLHLLGAANPRAAQRQPTAPLAGSLLETLWTSVADEFRALEPPAPAEPAPQPVRGLPPLQRLPAFWQLPAPPAAAPVRRLQLSAQPAALTPEYSWVGRSARALGTVVHAELHRLAAAPSLPSPQDLQHSASRYEPWLAELGVPAAERAPAQAVILEALERTLADARGRWLLSSDHPQHRSEWRLSGLHEGRIVNVIVDRMLLDAQGRRWIVDYKSSRHQGADLQRFIDSEAERYAPQLRRYAALAGALGPQEVRVALYFPLLGVFRELTLLEPG